MRLDRLLHTELYGAGSLPCRAHKPCQLLCTGIFQPPPPQLRSSITTSPPQCPESPISPRTCPIQKGSGVRGSDLQPTHRDPSITPKSLSASSPALLELSGGTWGGGGGEGHEKKRKRKEQKQTLQLLGLRQGGRCFWELAPQLLTNSLHQALHSQL